MSRWCLTTREYGTKLCLGKSLYIVFVCRVKDADKGCRSVSDHMLEVKQAILRESSLSPVTPANTALLLARQLLLPPLSPLTPHHTSTLISLLPPRVTLLTVSLSPKPHPSSSPYILVSKVAVATKPAVAGRRKGPAKRKATTQGVSPTVLVEKVCGLPLEAALEEVGVVLEDAYRSVTLKGHREWWAARHRLNLRLEQCLAGLEDMCLQWGDVLSFPGPVLLVLGRHLHRLPWECIPALQDTVVTRTPSLNFAAAHRLLVSC